MCVEIVLEFGKYVLRKEYDVGIMNLFNLLELIYKYISCNIIVLVLI